MKMVGAYKLIYNKNKKIEISTITLRHAKILKQKNSCLHENTKEE